MTMTSSIQKKVDNLASLCDQRNELELLVTEETSGTQTKIEEKRKQIYKLTDEIALLDAEVHEATPNLQEDLVDVKKRIADLMEKIKKECHKLPIKELVKGKRFSSEDGTVRVVVNKATAVTYYSADILKEVPGLVSMKVDGDPVVVATIDPIIMSRLIATEAVDAKVAEKYKTEDKKSNPGVRFEEL
jgi:hypothetical protein